jgi:cobyrinic acid a,c-diamide synthase
LELNQKQQGKAGFPGLVISALRGGSGKTIFSVGIIAALTRRGQTIAPFKKGPDYIDAGWLALAAGRPCYNLDTFLIAESTILKSYYCYTKGSNLAVIEGNRGLYDSIDLEGTTSTAALAKLLGLPVILCVDATKATRTMAAVVSGCQQFDPAVKIRGVILNQVAGKRHQNNLRSCIEYYCDLPVLGAVPKLKQQNFPERHMGLVPTAEHAWAKASIESVATITSKYLDLEAIIEIAFEMAHKHSRGSVERENQTRSSDKAAVKALEPASNTCVQRFEITGNSPKIGIVRDSAFQFYYPENFEALEAAGAELVFTSPLKEKALPKVDALYIGGGFPETHARQLAENEVYRSQIREMAHKGLPIYAECGGLMYLGDRLFVDDEPFAMVGLFPMDFDLHRRPQGHGYTIINVTGQNPFFEIGTEIRGHEFHYSKVIDYRGGQDSLKFQVQRGAGLIGGQDGICYQNVLATYTHIHSLGTPLWARAMVENAVSFSRST